MWSYDDGSWVLIVLQGVDRAKPLYNVQAVPILFPAANFNEVSGNQNKSDGAKEFHVIDGGIAVNDPVGFTSSHFLQFLLPTNIRHSQKLLLSYINALILRIWDIELGPGLCVSIDFSLVPSWIWTPLLIRISVQRCNFLIWFLCTIIIIFCNKNMVSLKLKNYFL